MQVCTPAKKDSKVIPLVSNGIFRPYPCRNDRRDILPTLYRMPLPAMDVYVTWWKIAMWKGKRVYLRVEMYYIYNPFSNTHFEHSRYFFMDTYPVSRCVVEYFNDGTVFFRYLVNTVDPDGSIQERTSKQQLEMLFPMVKCPVATTNPWNLIGAFSWKQLEQSQYPPFHLPPRSLVRGSLLIPTLNGTVGGNAQPPQPESEPKPEPEPQLD